jgi:hypothetical protein
LSASAKSGGPWPASARPSMNSFTRTARGEPGVRFVSLMSSSPADVVTLHCPLTLARGAW